MSSFSITRKKTPFQKHKEEAKKTDDEENARLYQEFVEPPAVMTAREASRRRPSVASLLLVLLSLVTLLLVFSTFHSSSPGIGRHGNKRKDGVVCNYSNGIWAWEPDKSLVRYDNSCKEIFKGWNCISGGKSNARELIGWRWKPTGCELPPLDPVQFLRRYRNTNIGFVGDSLNRNMFVSLVCMLRRSMTGGVRKWRPAGADRGFTFVDYNMTVAYHRTNLLVRYSW